MARARLWSPPVAVALLRSPLAIATEPVPLASHVAVPDWCPWPLAETQMFGAAAALCVPNAITPAAATPIRIANRLRTLSFTHHQKRGKLAPTFSSDIAHAVSRVGARRSVGQ